MYIEFSKIHRKILTTKILRKWNNANYNRIDRFWTLLYFLYISSPHLCIRQLCCINCFCLNMILCFKFMILYIATQSNILSLHLTLNVILYKITLKMNWIQQQVQQCVMYNLLMRWPQTTSFISLGWESCQKILDSIRLHFLVMLSNYFMIYENLDKNETEDLSL